jgi:HNH endonuclease/AP2 domain
MKIRKTIDNRITEYLYYNPTSGLFTWIKNPPGKFIIGKSAGCFDNRGYVIIKLFGICYKAHRLAFLFMKQPIPEYVDHINNITSDNRWVNLRPANANQNNQNRKVTKNNSTGYKGVRKDKKYGKFTASIWCGKFLYLGTFNSGIEAAKAYDDMAIQLFGDYAKINFLERVEDY